jgi:acetylornithine deacetylase/succinyl-diaminopimelate desuccinylase-like protein
MCAEKLEQLLRTMGYTTRRLDAAGFPAIAAETGPATGPTILFYGHYDVQPALLEDGWSHDPFQPVVRDGAIRGRGASDDKGQLIALLYGIELFRRAHGELPCRIRVLCEGAEEIGSPAFEETLREHRSCIDADMVVVADTGRFVPDRPSVICGLRGLAYLEVFVQGPRTDLHSGSFGGTVDNPAQVLANMLSALKDADGRIAVPGFYDDVVPPREDEIASVAAIPFDEEEYRRSVGVPALAGERAYGTLVRRWLRPALDIHGLTAGFQGEGAKTVLPARASAKVSCRLVVDQDPDTVLEQLERFFTALKPPTCEISFRRHAGARPVKLDLTGREAGWVLGALERAYGAPPLPIYDGATIPVVSTFAHTLGIPPFPLGFGRLDDGAHGPAEKFALEDFHKEMLAIAYLIEEAGRHP